MVRTENPGYLKDIRRIIVIKNIIFYRYRYQEQNMDYIYLESITYFLESQN